MYQCQMGKQTMGTPCHAFPHRYARAHARTRSRALYTRAADVNVRLDRAPAAVSDGLERTAAGLSLGEWSVCLSNERNECSCDNKLYRLNTFQRCLVRNQAQDEYCMDEYPNGCNAVVAVLSYTGYLSHDAEAYAMLSYSALAAYG